jgi:hypothetical protein
VPQWRDVQHRRLLDELFRKRYDGLSGAQLKRRIGPRMGASPKLVVKGRALREHGDLRTPPNTQ